MFECSICGLLSLNAVSCPACGSQNLIDLSTSGVQADDLPAEIPGLDEAAESWHEIEGSDGDFNDFSPKSTNSATANGSLPFGYSGESNIQASRLPFGIGSHADGIPFENQPITDENHVTKEEINSAKDPTNINEEDNHLLPSIQPEPHQPELLSEVMVEVVVKRPNVPRIQPFLETSDDEETTQDDDLPAQFEVPNNNIDLIPDEWRISASDVNMEEIYATKNEVVEIVHQYEEDIVIFDHQETNPVQSMQSITVDYPDVLSLELHPARALDVDLSSNPECREDLDMGYFAIAKNSWAEAAIKFQKIASRMPGDSSVYNNYGLALLQRAIEMAKHKDESVQVMASSQFESAILALREAAKSAPDESTILLNLAHALLVSGRAEKAMKIITVHNVKHPNSIEGANLEAASLVSLGQSVNAKAKLTKFKGDAIIDENLARLL